MLRGTIVLMFCVGGSVHGQPASSQPKFEVASVRSAGQLDFRPRTMEMSGGPGTSDPSRIAFQNFWMFNLITLAYQVYRYQLVGPSWIGTEMFDIVAKVPEGSTPEQVPLMLRNLLAERFHLTFHREKKEGPVYQLVVGKNGPKLHESVAEPAPNAPKAVLSASVPKLDAEGFPILSAGRENDMASYYGRTRERFAETSMEQFASELSPQLGRPVTDATGLRGKYDFSLQWVSEGLRSGAAHGQEADPGPGLIEAVQQQLGLRLEQKKGLIDVIVIDHIDKVPTEN